jgi:hypothetical protein
MNDSLPSVSATVTLLPECGVRRLQDQQYRPHIVIGPTSQREAHVAEGNVLTEQYLGVVFGAGPYELLPGVPAEVSFVLAYFPSAPDQYASVVPGAPFTLREGGSIVGYGIVKQRDA